jgi:hypothetical protein
VSIIELQRRARRLGEIRTGTTRTELRTKNGKQVEVTFPVSLETFRLTSQDRRLLEQAAALWGGEVAEWDGKWEVVTDAPELPVLIPPQNPDGIVWYETWTKAGLAKRCDGEHIVNTAGDPPPCNCDPDNRECKPITRVQLMLPDLADIGVWLLSSTGWNAATELNSSLNWVLRRMTQTGELAPASLALEQREVKRPGGPVKQFVVPVLRFQDRLGDLLGLSDGGGFSSLPSPSDAAGESGSPDSPPGDPPTLPDMPDTIKARLVDAGGPIHVETFPAEPDTGEDSDIASGVDDETVVEFPTPNDEQWALLLDTIAEDPVEGTMDVIEERVRRLYRLMRENGIEHWGGDALHAMLAKHHAVEHVRDLKRAELEKFAKTSWMHAEGAVANG